MPPAPTPSMPDRTVCVHCGKIGFVRREHVIKSGNAMTAFYCGACNRSWQVDDSVRPRDEKPTDQANESN